MTIGQNARIHSEKTRPRPGSPVARCQAADGYRRNRCTMPLGRLRQGGSCASTAAAAALALLLCGCAVEGLAFRSDDRVDVVAPDDLTEVTLPFTVQWTARDVRGRFGVFVDRTPQPPGKTLDWFARDDDECERVPGCPDKAYFAERRIFTTDERSFTVEAVKPT